MQYFFNTITKIRHYCIKLHKNVKKLLQNEETGYKIATSFTERGIVMIQSLPVYLASASPRRREILGMLGLKFDVEVSETEEITRKTAPEEIVQDLAKQKASAVAGKHINENCMIIGSDTIVWLNGHALGKPADDAEAARMLRSLSGNTHTVYTGVCLCRCENGKITAETFADAADVTFLEMSDEEIAWYVSTGECSDKAGAYAVKGLGARFVKKIKGDFYTVMGLPMARLYEELRRRCFFRSE